MHAARDSSGFSDRRPRIVVWFALAMVLLATACISKVRAAEVIPPKPERYFNDYTGKIDPITVDALNRQLEQFERDTSNQVRVVIYPMMQSDSSIEDYTVRVAQAWHIGMKGKNNGAILFVFLDDRKLYIQVGYGLEGALPDATCKQIIDEEITPHFRTGDYAGGLRAGVTAILAATRGEYKGSGRTKNEELATQLLTSAPCWVAGVIVFLLFGLMLFLVRNFGGTFYQHHVRSLTFAENAYLFLLSLPLNLAFSVGGSSSSGGGGGGGGFSSSGGGSFGGGGAGGSW